MILEYAKCRYFHISSTYLQVSSLICINFILELINLHRYLFQKMESSVSWLKNTLKQQYENVLNMNYEEVSDGIFLNENNGKFWSTIIKIQVFFLSFNKMHVNNVSFTLILENQFSGKLIDISWPLFK
jgi:hypothetical protein